MQILPKTLGTRPRLALELRAEGIVAARAEYPTAGLSAVWQTAFAEGAIVPGLKAGNIVDRVRVVAATREALDAVAGRAGDRGRDISIVVPDATVRVLLLEFDDLPSKTVDALAVVRFRLKKLVPFDADTAAVTYQVMSSDRGQLRVLVVAMPRDLLDEYEGVITAAGYLPGAVLPSTLASLSCLDEQQAPSLVVNAGRSGVTTAIVRGGVLLLHRTLDITADASAVLQDQQVVRSDDRSRGFERTEATAAIQTQVLEAAEIAMAAGEIAPAVSVAVAYFEDTLSVAPSSILVAGPLGAEGLAMMLDASGLEGLRVQELVGTDSLGPGAATMRGTRGWLAGVRGALRS